MSIHPLVSASSIEDSYRSYLLTTFAFRDPSIAEQFRQTLNKPGAIAKGPYLEATPPFTLSSTLRDLVTEGVLEPEVLQVHPGVLRADMALYRHQVEAVKKVAAGRNVVIATGTGSGKTEAFLLPILNHLLREKREGKLGPGVRALLLYPMNALVNDQLTRMRKLFASLPDITFGRYTGETDYDAKTAREVFLETHPGEVPLPNERLSREEIRESPPHILITNFAMLEFLLLRPVETPLFDDPKFASHWRFIVLDEAHTYGGAKGAEIAMLLRRLKERVVGGEVGRVRCIATSATIGRGVDDAAEVAAFAERLFGEPFEWNAQDPRRQDVVFAERASLVDVSATSWSNRPAPYYRKLRELMDQGSASLGDFEKLLTEAGVPAQAVRAFVQGIASWEAVRESAATLEGARHPGGDTSSPEIVGAALHSLLCSDPNVTDVRLRLAKGPVEPWELVSVLWPTLDPKEGLEEVIGLVELGARARPVGESSPLLPARYHYFVRALEGAFIRFVPKLELFLSRQVRRDGAAVFEAAACRQCGQLYLVGHVDSENHLIHAKTLSDEPDRLFLVSDGVLDPDLDDEDERVLNEVKSDVAVPFWLCPWCGKLYRERPDSCCGRVDPAMRVFEVTRPKSGLSRCASCGTRMRDPISRILTGQDAPVAVIASTLYERLPEHVPDRPVSVSNGYTSRWASSRSFAAQKTRQSSVRSSRKLLAFSDSRQEAAYFAWYLGATHSDMLWRRAILQVVRDLESQYGDCVCVPDIIDPLVMLADRSGLFLDETTLIEKRRQAWRYVMREFRAGATVSGLESVGALAFLPMSDFLTVEWDPWRLSEVESSDFWGLCLDQLRTRGAIVFPPDVQPTDEFFSPRNRAIYFRGQDAHPLRGGAVLGWRPTRNDNGRTDLFRRILRKRDVEDEAVVVDAVAGTWEYLSRDLADEGKLIKVTTNREAGLLYQTDPAFWRVTSKVEWGRCERCGTLTSHPRLRTCPVYRCEGTVRPVTPQDDLKENHYRRLYNELKLTPMRVEEHTAQLEPLAALEVQKKFERGTINVLSCSTTFEMGVDLGELEAVLMRNVPPEPANYVQRAGRAGRRRQAVAFVLTYAQRRSHDAAFYLDPKRMISGEIRPPSISLTNEKLVRRHLHSIALAWYFRRRSADFADLRELNRLVPEDDPYRVLKDLHVSLSNRPEDLLRSIRVAVPRELHRALEIEDWGWVRRFASPDPDDASILYDSIASLQMDLDYIAQVRKRRFEAGQPIDYLDRLKRTLVGKDVISFLSTRGVLPKYGFPVDVVSLEILNHDERARRLELQRDLRLAIGEFAPGSQVVAGGFVWTSYALKKPPRREWEKRNYAICKRCWKFVDLLNVDVSEQIVCPGCGSLISRPGQYLVPSFGFVTRLEAPLERPTQTRPTRAYASRVFFSHTDKSEFSDEQATGSVDFGWGTIEWAYSSHGNLVVVNEGPASVGYRVCATCGFAEPALSRPAQVAHARPYGGECDRPFFQTVALGHRFKTDILSMHFPLHVSDSSFWWSLTYALLEGVSAALSISRSDIDGCVNIDEGRMASPAIILFDDVPGGAGHVKRLTDRSAILESLRAAFDRVAHCECGEETSCYACLRNYRNQWCHDLLKRGQVAAFLKQLLAG